MMPAVLDKGHLTVLFIFVENEFQLERSFTVRFVHFSSGVSLISIHILAP
jgi:hypothetical protein